ncbi:MAG: hypothetical protein AABZ47_11280 [Planctomycetota bacterium]
MNVLRGGVTMVLLAGLAGCVLPTKKTGPLASRALEDASPGSPTETKSEERSPQLSAVEEFLARTKEYQIPSQSTAKVNQISPSGAQGLSTSDQALQQPTNNAGHSPERGNSPSASKTTNETSSSHKISNAQITLDDIQPTARQRQAIPSISGVTVRVPESPTSRNAGVADKVSVNQPVGVVLESASDSLDQLLKSLAEKVALGEEFDAEWQLRLHQLAMRRDLEAQQVSNHVSEETRRVMQTLFDLIVTIRGASRGSLSNGGRVLPKIDALREVFAGSSDPVVSTIALCKRVVTFGVYDEIPPEDLQAGKALQAIVYCEIGQVRSENGEDGRFRSRLSSRAELLTSDGQSVWQKEEGEIEDVCRKKRTDFFLAQRIVFPATLKPGEYVLKVLVEDKLSGRAAENSMPLTITLPSAVTSRR